MVRVFTTFAASLALLAPSLSSAVKMTFTNKCDTTIQLYDNVAEDPIAPQQSKTRDMPIGWKGMFRHGSDPQATLAEFNVEAANVWYDISAIPTGPKDCKSHEDCAVATEGRSGFNVPMAIIPSQTVAHHCRKLICEHKKCDDAYLFPTDDKKMADCPTDKTSFEIVFCPSGKGAAPAQPAQGNAQQAPSQAPNKNNNNNNNNNNQWGKPPAPMASVAPAPFNNSTSQGNGPQGVSFDGAQIKSSFTYRGEKAGNVPGSYEMVVGDLKQCSKQKVDLNSPVGPMSEDVTMVFRGPMNIYNIAVFDGSEGGDWKRVSSYDLEAKQSNNLVFMNNKNIDYVTGGARSPQGLASADGLTNKESAEVFSGKLQEASDPSKIGAGPGIDTGAEVNIMTEKKCEKDTCKGYFDQNGYQGWNGGKKMFVTKVQMPQGSKPNQPAIWMLNSQIVRSNQYGCNCRGMGAKGGCGELDIAEVIETLPSRDKVTTHYYFYEDGNAGADNYAARPTDAPTTYVTLIDDSGEGTIKILEIGANDFDFSAQSISASQIKKWIDAKDMNLIQK